MAKKLTPQVLLSRYVTRKDRVLLINPPVEETRYSWIRWNQPLDLLKLASYLRSHIECKVELLDFMKPDLTGHVHEEWLPRDRRYHTVKGERYPMRRFGQPYSNYLNGSQHGGRIIRLTNPTQVWITSLCSYWYESVAEMCRIVRQSLPDTQVVLIGQYARFLPDHACDACAADFVVSQPFDLSNSKSNLDLYREKRPPFIAVQLNPKVAVERDTHGGRAEEGL